MEDSFEERMTEMEAITQIFEGEVRYLEDASLHDHRQHGGAWVVFEISIAEHYPLNDVRNYAAVLMTMRLGPKYPHREPPKISMTRCTDYHAPSDVRVHELRRFAAQQAETHIGQLAVYEVVTAVREKLAGWNKKPLALHDEMLRRKGEEEEIARKEVTDEMDRRERDVVAQQQARHLDVKAAVERNRRKILLQESYRCAQDSPDDDDNFGFSFESPGIPSETTDSSSSSSARDSSATSFWDITPALGEADASSRSRVSASLNEADLMPTGLPGYTIPDTTDRSSAFMRQLLRQYFMSLGIPSDPRLIPSSILDSQDRKFFVDEQKDLSKFRRLFKADIANAAKSRDPDCEKFWKALVSHRKEGGVRRTTSRFNEDFNFVRSLGRGGFGSVVKAKNRLDGRYYAVKRVPLYGSDLTSRHILREVVTLSRMTHPNIVRYHQAWLEDADDSAFGNREPDQEWTSTGGYLSLDSNDVQVNKYLYIQMEYCKQTLRQFIDSVDDTNIDLWAIFRQIVEGLNDIHSRKIVHRDLKPTNIFMGHLGGDIKIGDFGLAMDTRTASVPNTNQSSLGDIAPGSSFKHYLQSTVDFSESESPGLIEIDQTRGVGTLLYRAPELDDVKSTRGYTSKVDIFSLGIIAWELFHGPYSTAHERAMELDRLKDRGPSKSFELAMPRQANLIRDLLQADPENRPSAEKILNGDYLPPKHEDDYTRDIMRQVAQVGSSVRKRVVDQLFFEDIASPRVHPEQPVDLDEAHLRHRIMTETRNLLHASGLVELHTSQFLSGTGEHEKDAILTRNGCRLYPRRHLLDSFISVASNLDCDLRRFEIGSVWNFDSDEAGPVDDSSVRRNIVVEGDPKMPWSESLQLDVVLASPWAPAHAEIIQLTKKILRGFGARSNLVLRIGHTSLSSAILNRCGVPREKIEATMTMLDKQRREWTTTRKQLAEYELPGQVIDKLAQFDLAKGCPTQTLPKLCHLLHLSGKKSRPVPEVDKYLNAKHDGEHVTDRHVTFSRRVAPGGDTKSGARSSVPMTVAHPLDELAVLLHHLSTLQCGEDAWEIILDPLFGTIPGSPYQGLLFEISWKDPSSSATVDCLAAGGNWNSQMETYGKLHSIETLSFATGITLFVEWMLQSSLLVTRRALDALRMGDSTCDVFVVGGSVDHRVRVRGLLFDAGIRCSYLERTSPSFKEQKLAAVSHGARCIVELEKSSAGHMVITRLNGRESTICTTDDELVGRLRQLLGKGAMNSWELAPGGIIEFEQLTTYRTLPHTYITDTRLATV